MFFGKKANIIQFFIHQVSSKEKQFILYSLLSCFLISLDFGIVRPAMNSLFIAAYTVKWIPYEWIVTIPINFLVVIFYNRFLPKWGSLKTFYFTSSVVITLNTFAAFYLTDFYFFPFIQCIVKDIYILLMFKQLWSMNHATFESDKAKVFYGLYFGVGGLGSLIGNLIPGFFALQIGSQQLFFFTLPIYLCLMWVFQKAFLASQEIQGQKSLLRTKEDSYLTKNGTLTLFKKNFTLVYVLLLVVFMQMSISLIDFQFNTLVAEKIPNVDLRTQYLGKILSIMNFIPFIFQLLLGFLFLHYFGLKRSHFFVPIFLTFNALGVLIHPSLAICSYAFISIKAIDYSLFSIAREILYIPLSLDEKYRAKAFIDVFVYRAARGLGSIFILFSQFFLATKNLFFLLSSFSLFLLCLWSFTLVFLFKDPKYEKLMLPKGEGVL